MPWGAAIAAGGSLLASGLSSSTQASAAEQAAQDQEQAAMAQMGLDANIFNAQSAMELPTREVGGEAQAREAYLLGLDPNLNISQDFESPTIGFNTQNGGTSSLGYTDGYGNSVGTPAAPGSPGSTQLPNGTWVQGSNGVASNPTPSGMPNPNGIYGSGVGAGSATPGMGGAPVSFGGQNYGGTATPQPGTGSPTAGGAPAAGGASAGGAFGSFASPYNPSTFYQDPGYQFILGQNENQISNQQAVTGGALSPAALSAAMNYSSGMASQEFNNAYNRSINTQTTQLNELNALSSGGQIATSGVSSAASGLGTAGSSAIAGYGNAGAAGSIGVGNAISSGINGGANAINSGIYGYGGGYGYGGLNGGMASYNNAVATDPYATFAPTGGGSWSSDGSTWIPSGTGQ
jgi:hypothetical protein